MELKYIKGIGPKRAEAFQEIGIERVDDLLNYFPRRYADAKSVQKLRGIAEHVGTSVLVRGEIISLRKREARKMFLTVVLQDDSGGTLDLVYFTGAQYYSERYHVGDELLVIGRLGLFNNRAQIVQPEYVEELNENKDVLQGSILPFYSLPGALSKVKIGQPTLRSIIRLAIELPEATETLSETLPADLLDQYKLAPRSAAIHAIHFPESDKELQSAVRRLTYEELFFLQLRLVLERYRNALRSHPGIRFEMRNLLVALEEEKNDGDPKQTLTNEGLAAELLRRLPFSLTNAQVRVLREIAKDMSKASGATKPMHRLLQGDVGSGKTIVAALAMLSAIENGYQCALMAPTEILAEQHYRTLAEVLKGLPINLTLLVGSQKKKERTLALADLAEGITHIAVGTHALIEENVRFEKLGFIVIDEQHRFGVAQRKRLIEKAYIHGEESGVRHAPDVLIMTATPIPRTLSLTLYGDLDVSVIDEYPKSRKPIVTKLLYQDEQPKILQSIRNAVLQRSEQVFIVYPLVETSEKLDLAAATKAFDDLQELVPDVCFGLLHGKMSGKEKQEVMMRFRDKEIDVLVSTTVIEVGIDIPNATAMIIEHAERFGLAQLHQLRGRVGRGGAQSYCILVASQKLRPKTDGTDTSAQIEQRETAMKRLETMVRTNNGFEIAEVDLEIRGPGEFFGTKQSGLPELQIADIVHDVKMFQVAHDDAEKMVGEDPHLRKQEHAATRKAFLERYAEVQSYLGIG